MSLIARLRDFDAYTKPLEDFRVRTFTGGAETASFLRKDVVEQLYVDSTPAEQRVDIHFDVTFPRLQCGVITIDVMDISGDNQDDIKDDVYKSSLGADGKVLSGRSAVKQEVNVNTSSPASLKTIECGSCYGARGGCCNTCEDVKEAYALRGWQLDHIENIEQCQGTSWVKALNEHKNEGCRVYGKVQVAKVAGNFHIAPGDPLRSHRSHYHDLHSLSPSKFDTSHTVNHLSFGKSFPGKEYPLDGKEFGTETGTHGIMHQYFVKLVPTMYVYLDSSRNVFSHQFSVTTYQKDISQGASGLPGFFVQYEFSPLMVKYEERRKYLAPFLVSLCAIIGGIFTVASLIDSFIYNSSKILQQKISLNKLT